MSPEESKPQATEFTLDESDLARLEQDLASVEQLLESLEELAGDQADEILGSLSDAVGKTVSSFEPAIESARDLTPSEGPQDSADPDQRG